MKANPGLVAKVRDALERTLEDPDVEMSACTSIWYDELNPLAEAAVAAVAEWITEGK